MKKLLFCILYCSSVKVSAAEKPHITVPSCDQRSAIVTFEDNDNVVGFTVRVGMKKSAIETFILGRSPRNTKKSLILTPEGNQLPATITPLYLNANYPHGKNIELQVFSEQ